MFYNLVFIILLIFLLVYLNIEKMHTPSLILVLVAYFASILSIILYLSRSTYYYYLLKDYFYLPQFLWRKFFFFNINKFALIRIMNVSSLLIIPFSVHFSFTFSNLFPHRLEKAFKCCTWISSILQVIFYDPQVNIVFYYWIYSDILSPSAYSILIDRVQTFTKTINCSLILISIGILILSYFKMPRLRHIRSKYLCLFSSFGLLGIAYIFFISIIPAVYLNISKISNSYTFKTLYLKSHMFIYQAFPYAIALTMTLLIYASYHLSKLNRQIMLNELSISKQISASETTSKIFCHYIKNEVLALQAQLDMLDTTNGKQELIGDMKNRCILLYERIDEVHRNTRTGELNMSECNMKNLITNTLSSYTQQSTNCTIITDFPPAPVIACVDKHYMIEALDNIVRNGIEAMQTNIGDRKDLLVTLKTLKDWIVIEVTDTGVGISSENIPNIFTPFYSSYPYSKHWGIGLSLTYKVIRAHEGNIEVTSTPGKGTTIKVLLPLLSRKPFLQKVEFNPWKKKSKL